MILKINDALNKLKKSGLYSLEQMSALEYAIFLPNVNFELLLNPSISADYMVVYAKLMSNGIDVTKYIENHWRFKDISVQDLEKTILAENSLKKVTMAKDMMPSKEYWEKLGFQFEDIPGDNVLCNAILPKNWNLIEDDYYIYSYIFDSEGRKRGSMRYDYTDSFRYATMSLDRRYGVNKIIISSDEISKVYEVFFGNSQEKLFIAGTLYYSKPSTEQERHSNKKIRKELENKAKKYGDEFYPNWQDPLAYWNDELYSCKKRVKNN